MRSILAVGLVALGTTVTARAEPSGYPSTETIPVTFTLGTGVAWTGLQSAHLDPNDNFSTGLTVRADVGVRVDSHLAVGAHLGWAHADGRVHYYQQGDHDMEFAALELGVAAQLLFDRAWIAPWIGVSELGGIDLSTEVARSLAYGIGAGVTVLRYDDNRAEVFGSITRSTKENPDFYLGEPHREPFWQLVLGVDYRL